MNDQTNQIQYIQVKNTDNTFFMLHLICYYVSFHELIIEKNSSKHKINVYIPSKCNGYITMGVFHIQIPLKCKCNRNNKSNDIESPSSFLSSLFPFLNA